MKTRNGVIKLIAVITLVALMAGLCGFTTVDGGVDYAPVTTSDFNATILTTESSYIVLRGDTLFKIAVKYFNDGKKYKEIASYNNIANPNLIYVGQELKIPQISTIYTPVEATPAVCETPVVATPPEVSVTPSPDTGTITVETAVPEPTPTEPVVTFKYIDCDLSTELQDYTNQICTTYGVPFELAMAVMYNESRFKVNAKNGCYLGLMQIGSYHMPYLTKAFGITDLMDPKSNILAGVAAYGGYIAKYKDYNKAIMCYALGEGGAQGYFKQGIYSTGYSRSVVAKMDEYLAR